MPRHVRQRTVDHEKEEHHEKHIGRKAHTLSKRTCDQRRGDDGELHLEQGEQCQRDGCTAQDVACRSGIYIGTHTVEHRERQRIANHTADIIAKAQRETYDHPEH